RKVTVDNKEITILEPLLEKQKSSGWGNKLLSAQREHLLSVIMIQCPDFNTIPKEFYLLPD
ncbi:MAG: hypothetical protein K2M03_05710, partial [Muribaculaceae bacterium]|nr:hypothetical protein [Muribaculaceae bacterium]